MNQHPPPDPQQPPQSSQYPGYPSYPQYAPPPPMPPRKRSRAWPWIVGVIALLLVCACGLIATTSHSTNSSRVSTADNQDATTSPVSHRTVVITQYTATPTHRALTPTATHATIPTPTHAAQGDPLAPVPGPMALGQPVSHFVAQYGPPNVIADGDYYWRGPDITVFAFSYDERRVSAVLYAGSDGNGWSSVSAASAVCRAFLPSDATYKRTVDITGANPGVQHVYYSPSSAPLFQASEFTDENGNVTTPGTLAIVFDYNHADMTHIDECSVQVGLQGV